METEPIRTTGPAPYLADAKQPAMSWSAIWAGATAAIALSLVLLTLGSGFGLAAASPWPGTSLNAVTFTISAGIWLIVMQWMSAAMGGYFAGRLRNKWHGLHTHESFFRDTAHGFLAWATATIVVAAVALAATAFAAAEVTQELVDDTVMMQAAQERLDTSALASIFTALAMVIGAFIACVAGAIGGQQRDQHP